MVIQVAGLLSGERKASDLPLPYTIISDFVKRRGFSSAFAGLVYAYDVERLSRHMSKKHVNATRPKSS